jgi:hypothetical protein
MDRRASTDIANRVFSRDVRAPRHVTCVSHRRGVLAS